MIRRFTIFFMGAMLVAGSSHAQEKPPGFYLSGSIGQSTFFDVDADGDDVQFDLFRIFASGHVGYRFRPDMGLELELLLETTDIDNSADSADIVRGTLSGYYDFDERTLLGSQGIRPYAVGGLGFAKVDIGAIENNALTWHPETGLSIPIDDDHLDFVPGFRFEYIFLDNNDGFDDDL